MLTNWFTCVGIKSVILMISEHKRVCYPIYSFVWHKKIFSKWWIQNLKVFNKYWIIIQYCTFWGKTSLDFFKNSESVGQ